MHMLIMSSHDEAVRFTDKSLCSHLVPVNVSVHYYVNHFHCYLKQIKCIIRGCGLGGVISMTTVMNIFVKVYYSYSLKF